MQEIAAQVAPVDTAEWAQSPPTIELKCSHKLKLPKVNDFCAGAFRPLSIIEC